MMSRTVQGRSMEANVKVFLGALACSEVQRAQLLNACRLPGLPLNCHIKRMRANMALVLHSSWSAVGNLLERGWSRSDKPCSTSMDNPETYGKPVSSTIALIMPSCCARRRWNGSASAWKFWKSTGPALPASHQSQLLRSATRRLESLEEADTEERHPSAAHMLLCTTAYLRTQRPVSLAVRNWHAHGRAVTGKENDQKWKTMQNNPIKHSHGIE